MISNSISPILASQNHPDPTFRTQHQTSPNTQAQTRNISSQNTETSTSQDPNPQSQTQSPSTNLPDPTPNQTNQTSSSSSLPHEPEPIIINQHPMTTRRKNNITKPKSKLNLSAKFSHTYPPEPKTLNQALLDKRWRGFMST